jgi:2Fe-2S iron-sulfur cluster binding domain
MTRTQRPPTRDSRPESCLPLPDTGSSAARPSAVPAATSTPENPCIPVQRFRLDRFRRSRPLTTRRPAETQTSAEDRRLAGPVTRGREVQVVLDGEEIVAFAGENVVSALLAADRRGHRVTPRRQEVRGMFCGIGLCFDCVMTIDGLPGVRACQTPVSDGMQLETQHGYGSWPIAKRQDMNR